MPLLDHSEFIIIYTMVISDWRRQWQPTPVLLPGKSHGRRSLVGCSPWGRWESDTTERLHFHFSLSCIGEGNGNPLQCSCLENPRDGGAWWAAVYGVAQSQTRLEWLGGSSISDCPSLSTGSHGDPQCLDTIQGLRPGFTKQSTLTSPGPFKKAYSMYLV